MDRAIVHSCGHVSCIIIRAAYCPRVAAIAQAIESAPCRRCSPTGIDKALVALAMRSNQILVRRQAGLALVVSAALYVWLGR